MKVLITGSEGTIGKILQDKLKNHDLVLIDQEKGERNVQADILDNSEIEPYFKDIETVIHLAADRRNYISRHSLIIPNIEAIWNVFETAEKNGVQRVIYSSSLNVYPWDDLHIEGRMISFKTETRANNDYGLTKIIGESIGLNYHRKYGMSVVNLRLGSVNLDDKPNGYAEENQKKLILVIG